MGQNWDNTRSALCRHIERIQWFVHNMVIPIVIMWVTCLAMLWLIEGTTMTSVVSRHLPLDSDGQHQQVFEGYTVLWLSGFIVALPCLLILLIAAGALHRPAHCSASARRTEA